ncbi:hypothetical protein KXX06_002944 [Aspergillus fumigatus]|nr:hypothetical protein KXX06_002944 [Aspergillus fumigatus]
MTSESTPSKGGGLSLYANLLDPSSNASSPGTISRAPVVFKQASEGDSQTDDSAAKKQQLSAALPKSTPGAASAPAPPVKTTLADWAATEEDDVNGFYIGEKRQRGGRKKRKKNREAQAFVQNWDDIYDPSRPNIYEEYKHSDEQIAEVREWKDRLYAHRMARSPSRSSHSADESRPMNSQSDALMSGRTPPAPPPPPEEAPAPIPDDPTGEDAYLRRVQMAAAAQPTLQAPTRPPPRPLDALQPASATISRAPVRYTLPPPPEDIPATEAELEEVFAKEEPAGDAPDEEDGQRSLRPGQKGFAERLLAKYGWTKGSGLGATGSGIVKPLQVKVEKQKKRPDSEGGGFVTPAGRGKIIGGKRKAEEEEGKFGRMSEVIILKGMLDGMDVDAELEGDQDGGLIQEIGEECSEKYGRVERVFISRESGPPVPVFVKFTNQLSALRAVNALEGRVFNGNTITARFYDTQKFEEGIYDDR